MKPYVPIGMGVGLVVVTAVVASLLQPDAPVAPLTTPAPTEGEYYPEAEATNEPSVPYEGDYCVREGGFPSDGYSESDYPGCTWVDRIEDVPEGATFLPSHGGVDDPEAIRRFWCLDHSGDAPPPPEEISDRCLRFYADEYGGEYAEAARERG